MAACFLDSMAALGLPGHGCGIRYQYGLFEQKIVDGNQIEQPDNWMVHFYLWEYRRDEKAVQVAFGGPLGTVTAVPYDIPVIGYGNETVNTLRLWSAEVPKDLMATLASLSSADMTRAVQHKYSVEALSQILYPDDRFQEGRTLRLAQEYFLGFGRPAEHCQAREEQGGNWSPSGRIRRRPHQRHPSVAGDSRADAPVDGQGRTGLGRGLASHDRDRFLHQSHGDAGGAGKVAGGHFPRPAAADLRNRQ